MTLKDAENSLPNGLHDARLIRYSVDYENGVAKLELDAWMGDIHSDEEVSRERTQRVLLKITGLKFFAMDPPDPKFVFNGMPQIGGFEAWSGKSFRAASIQELAVQCGGNFAESTFVTWNCFLHVAGDAATIEILK